MCLLRGGLAIRVARDLTGEAVEQPRRNREEHQAQNVRDRCEAVADERQRQRRLRARRARDARVDDAEQGLADDQAGRSQRAETLARSTSTCLSATCCTGSQ